LCLFTKFVCDVVVCCVCLFPCLLTGIFQDKMLGEDLLMGENGDPISAWGFVWFWDEYKPLALLAIELLQIPTGIADVERSFSPLRKTQCWWRGSLGPATLDNMIYVEWNKRLLDGDHAHQSHK